MAVILRYFAELVYDVIVKQLHRFQNPLLIVSDHINKNSSGDEIANVNFYAVRPEATRIR